MTLSNPRKTLLGTQSGMSLIEVLIGSAIAVLVIGTAGTLFLGQAKGYQDIGTVAKLQSVVKVAVQNMSTEIPNTGACMNNKRYNFIMDSIQIKFTYLDLKKRHCAETDTATISYYKKTGTSGDTLYQSIKCNNLTTTKVPLVRGQGAIILKFKYFDKLAAVTAVAANVRSIEFSIDVKTKQGKSLFERTRKPVVRVGLVN